MGEITDKKITKVYPGKVISGKGQFFNFYLEGGKLKYGLFVAKGKTVPKEGMRIASMEWETVQEGEYTNNKVKTIVWMGVSEQSTGKQPEPVADRNNPLWFLMSYAKDVAVAYLQKGPALPDATPKDICLDIVDNTLLMLDRIKNPRKEEPKEEGLAEPKQEPDTEPPPSDDEIPF